VRILRKGVQRMIRTTFEEDQRLYAVKAVTSDLVTRYTLDSQGNSLYWFVDEYHMHSWILSYSSELIKSD